MHACRHERGRLSCDVTPAQHCRSLSQCHLIVSTLGGHLRKESLRATRRLEAYWQPLTGLRVKRARRFVFCNGKGRTEQAEAAGWSGQRVAGARTAKPSPNGSATKSVISRRYTMPPGRVSGS